MRARAALPFLAWALLASGCDSGQTGSPTCALTAQDCVCEVLSRDAVVRGTVTETWGGFYRLTVEEVFRTPAGAVGPGIDVVTGYQAQPFGCSQVLEPFPDVGDELFAAFDGPVPPAPGAPEEMLVSGVAIAAWEPWLDFGDGHRFSADELPSMVGSDQCAAAVGPDPVCDDTGSCTVSARPGPFHGWVALIAAAFVATCLRRSRRRQPALE